jgi:hypothetical protein
MTGWASNGEVKIERAKEHIGDLAVAIAAFHQTDPYELFQEEEAGTGALNARIRIREKPPLRLGAIAGDAVHNFRAALDILWRIAMRAGPGRKTEFPFNNGPQEFENAHRGAIKGRSKTAVEILRTIKPFKGGNELLWGLHVADIVDKHHTLIPAYVSTNPVAVFDMAVFMRDAPRPAEWGPIPSFHLALRGTTDCPVEDGAIICRIEREHRPKEDMNLELTPDIAFGEPEVFRGKPMVETLNQMAGVVDGVVESFRTAGLIA